MVKVSNRSEVDDAIDEVWDSFQSPVSTASKFYTLLYLADVKGVDEVDYDLFKLQNELTDAFLNYTIYAVTREIGRKSKKLQVQSVYMRDIATGRFSSRTNSIFKDIKQQEDFGQTPREVLESLEGALRTALNTQMGDGEPEMAYRILTDSRYGIQRGAKKDTISNEMEIMEDRYSALSQPFRYLEAAKSIFELDYSGIGSNTQWGRPRQGGETGWSINYGGEPWGAVCSTAQQAQDLSDKAYVDIMFSVEHNNGNFLNKIPALSTKEESALEEFFPVTRGRQAITVQVYDSILPAILNAAKEENIRPLYKIAKRTSSELRRRSINENMFPPEKNLGVSDEFGD